MNNPATSHPFRLLLFTLLNLGCIYHAAPWPAVQAVLNAFLVLALAPEFRSILVGAFWAAMAGWVLEGTMRSYPHLGGTALGNLTTTILAAWTLAQWPTSARQAFLSRLAVLTVIHALLVHGAVRIACGPHPWGWGGWLLTLVTVPLWGTLAFKLHRPLHRR
ncbi:MAG: hypothetical protein Q8O00_07265 [Holophaga sp.]|nr:hypothetical protein [Holophaga sp.]